MPTNTDLTPESGHKTGGKIPPQPSQQFPPRSHSCDATAVPMATATRYVSSRRRGGLGGARAGRVHSALRGGGRTAVWGEGSSCGSEGRLWLKQWVSVWHVCSEWQDNRVLINHVFQFVCFESRPSNISGQILICNGWGKNKKKRSLEKSCHFRQKHSVCDPNQALISANHYLVEMHVLWDVLHLENLHLSHMHSGSEALNKLHSCIICLPVIFFHRPGYSTVFKILPWQATCVESLWKHVWVFWSWERITVCIICVNLKKKCVLILSALKQR